MTNTSLLQSFKIQCRVIGALTLREVLTRYGRKNIGFLWLFVEPIIFIGSITYLWNATKGVHGFKLPITAFAVTGYSSVLLWRNMVSRCSGAMTPNVGLLFHRNVKMIDVFAARILLELAGATTSFVALSVILISLGFMDPPVDILKVVFGWVMLTWFGASLALVLGSLSEKSDIVEKIWKPVSYFLLPFSGVAYMVDWLGKEMQTIVLYLPMIHGLEVLREGYFGDSVRSHYDLSYLGIICLCLTFLGLRLSRQVGKGIVPS